MEAGARLQSEGDIVVGGGIVGRDTLVASKASITTKFIQDATVHTGENLVVGRYIYNAFVRCRGMVTVHQGGAQRSGTIAGGRILAAQGIQASFAGSPSGTSTELVVGVDPTIEDSLHKCQRQLAQCQEDLDQLHRLLGLEEVTLTHLKSLLQRVTPQKRPKIAEYIRQWQQLNNTLKDIQARRSDLKETLIQPTLQAILSVKQIIYPGVKLRLGQHTTTVQLELGDTVLTQDNWDEQFALQAAA